MINKDRLFNRLMELGQIGNTEDGVYCMALSKEENEAHALVAQYMKEAGMTVHMDAAGNLVGRKEGTDPNASVVMTGSHIDTVYGGGMFDGRLGVIGGIEAVQAMTEEGIVTKHPIEVIGYRDEEGTRFVGSYSGAGHLTGGYDHGIMTHADKDGKKLSITWLTYPTRLEQPKLAEYAQSTLKDIGIEVNVNNTADHATYAKNGEFDVYVSSLTTAPTGDPEYFFTSTVVSDAAKNYGKYSNSDVDDIVAKLHETFDTDERGKLAVEAQQTILDDDAYFFVSHLNMGLVSKANVSGLAAHPCDYYEITADLEVK